MTAVSSKSASLRSSSLYFQRRVPRSTVNPDLSSPSLSSEDESGTCSQWWFYFNKFISILPSIFFVLLILVTSSEKPLGETSHGIVKNKLFDKSLPTTKSKQII
ncbi:unnamed protein product [Rotaria sp. Silwood2]|nr:unnamed protein product [Rotaria sp. Silwood2]CAF4133739.1 unnamed protein product [Rotaria sp. Silwood2]CAF4559167.1 unnamed protein product [Rotaria sp. Silwood2]CAF4800493.1 unnamed protein product [Rotaria sp. Silwood2]